MKKLFKLAAVSPVSLTVLLSGLLSIGPVNAKCDGLEEAAVKDTAAQDATAKDATAKDAGPEVVEAASAKAAVVEAASTGAAVVEDTRAETKGVGVEIKGLDVAATNDPQPADFGPARDLLDSFSGDLVTLQLQFTQVVKSQDGRIQDQTGGHATLQNPDMLYWVYQGEFPETIVADGTTVWIYDEALEQVTVKPQSASVSDTPLMILTDVSQLDEQFLVTESGDFEDMQLLELRSRNEESEFERILLGLDDEGIKMMVMEDAYGQRTEIRFSDIIKNAEIDTELFNFTPPEGVDVVGEMPQPQ